MAEGKAEWAVLSKALETVPAACDGDQRFLHDTHVPHIHAEMRFICGLCPVLELCKAYAEAARPAGGYWAGQQHPIDRRRK